MNLVRAYKYFFYRTYVWQLNLFGEENNPKFTAILANSICVFINLITLTVFFQIATGYKIYIENIYAVVATLALILFNYFVFLHKNKANAIINEFASETENQRKSRTKWCLVYAIATYLIFFVSVLILSPTPK
jgi:Ca2+/Na+ antiporter